MTVRSARGTPKLSGALKTHAKSAYSAAILGAAERLFLLNGYHATHMAQVAVEAGISVGTLYKHFPSKEAVLESLADRGRVEALALIRRCLEQEEPKQRLNSMVHELFRYVESQNAVFAVLAELSPQGEPYLSPGMRESDDRAALEVMAMTQSAFEEGVKAGCVRADIEPGVLAALFVGAVRGALLAWIAAERSYPLSTRAEPLMRLFWEGATVR